MSSQYDKHPASETLTLRLERCYTGVVHDVMRGMGLRDFTLPPELRPLMPETAMAGPAFTIRGKVDKGADAHQTLLAWTGLLSQAPSGTIWTTQPNDRIVAHMGELSAETLKSKGVMDLYATAISCWLSGSRLGAVVLRPATWSAIGCLMPHRSRFASVMWTSRPGTIW